MKKKSLCSIFAALITCLTLTGCNIAANSGSETISQNNETVSSDVSVEDIGWESYENPMVFESVEEFAEYIQGESITLATDEDYTHKTSEENFRTFTTESKEKNTELPVVDMSVFEETMDAELEWVGLNNTYVSFLIHTPTDQEKMIDAFGSDNPEEIAKEMNKELRDAAKDADGQATRGGVPEPVYSVEAEAVTTLNDRIAITYDYEGNGELALSSFIGMNAVHYWEDHPGYYYTGAPYVDMENPPGYMIYWAMDGYFYQAGVPASQLETFWQICDNMMLGYSIKNDEIS